jgi:hypothetical protein
MRDRIKGGLSWRGILAGLCELVTFADFVDG